MMENSEERQAVTNYSGGKYTREEYRRVKRQFLQEDDEELKKVMQSQWNDLPAEQPLNDRLTRLLEKLKSENIRTTAAKKRNIFNFYQKVAAVMFLPLFLAFSYWMIYSTQNNHHTAMATIHSPEGARTEFVLPDGSTGWLNSGSALTYPVNFGTSREVSLSGEAFFHVQHRNGKKFLVKTGELTVQVLGTSFNVSAYKSDPQISVVLQEGSIQILGQDDKPTYLMKPDEQFDYDISRKVASISRVNATELTLWTQGVLRFDGDPLSVVMEKLARWYNVDFEIKDLKTQQYNFKATFKNEQLDEILRMIALTTPLKYKIEERKLNKNGIYIKKKIIIEGR